MISKNDTRPGYQTEPFYLVITTEMYLMGLLTPPNTDFAQFVDKVAHKKVVKSG